MDIMKPLVEKLLIQTNRQNIQQLLQLMDQQGYYSVHCARHHRFVGGSMQHSLEVLLYALENNINNLPKDSLILVCLLHDLCNIHGYHEIRRHGSRSVRLVTQIAGVPLTDDEASAILWHMHGLREIDKLPKDFAQTTQSTLWQLLRMADRHSAKYPSTAIELMQRFSSIDTKCHPHAKCNC
jgi:hypothetical protein